MALRLASAWPWRCPAGPPRSAPAGGAQAAAGADADRGGDRCGDRDPRPRRAPPPGGRARRRQRQHGLRARRARAPATAAGLATPYLLTGPGGQDPAASGCPQSNPNLQAFVQATILNPATGRLWVYEPLVITLGSPPAVAPVGPKLPKGAVVNLMVGFNGNNLQLAGAQPNTLTQARCVDGLDGSLFGQVSYCNSVAFYAAAGRHRHGRAAGPPAGTSPVTGQPCPTTRSFDLVDQDPSDNVTTQYLLTADGETAQDNTASAADLPGATAIINGSDNGLLDNFVLPALGCPPFTAPDISNGGRPGTSQTLDELSAAASQREPVALVPENDPMTPVNGALSQSKTNLYRIGVGQPLVIGGMEQPFGDVLDGGQQADTPANFCANMLNTQTAFIAASQARFTASPSPVPAMGNNLFTFMAARLSASFANLGCGFGLKNTVNLGQDAQGVATSAAFSLVPQVPSAPARARQTSSPPSTRLPQRPATGADRPRVPEPLGAGPRGAPGGTRVTGVRPRGSAEVRAAGVVVARRGGAQRRGGGVGGQR